MFIKNRFVGFAAITICFALALVFTSSAEYASLRVNCVPTADVFIDGAYAGESNRAFVVDAGVHKIEVTSDHFESYETVIEVTKDQPHTLECSLLAQDPSDPWVIAKLAASQGVDVAPFVAPELLRGHARRKGPVMLLWPSRDVRKQGLVNFAIEADETYDSDGTLEFRQGRTVLYREAFKPEGMTTVRPIPAAVLEAVKTGRKFTWGIYFEDGRRPVKKTLKIVKRPKVERQLKRIRNSKHIQRQPVITQQILAATVLENNRLYTEALAANLKVASDHPQSTQPYRGIVTTLRRLDAEGSELFAFVAPTVSGKGGHSGVARPNVNTGRGGAAGLGLGHWAPKQTISGPNAAKPTEQGTQRRSGPEGVTPQGGSSDKDTPNTPDDIPADRGEDVTPDSRDHEMRQMRDAIAKLEADHGAASREATDAQEAHTAAERAAQDAETAAQAAEQAAEDARTALEGAAEPTPEQRDAMRTAGEEAEAAREAANAAQQQLGDARQRLDAAQTRMDSLKGELDSLKQAADQADGVVPEMPGQPEAPNAADLQAGFETATQEAQTAQENLDAARAAHAAAEQAQADNPSEANANALESARAALEAADSDATAKEAAVAAARAALDGVAGAQPVEESRGR